MARPEESPRFPIVCFDGNATYLVGDLDSNLMLRGFFFRPIPVQGEIELQLVHPYCRREQVIKFMRLMLRRAFDSINFPLCRLSPTPPGEPLPFIFRVDIDYMVDPGLGLLRRATADYGWKITGFINISGEELWEDTGIPPPNGRQNIENLRWIPDFAEEGHEVASHGVRHLLWAKRRNNFDDISEARKILEDLCNHPVVGHAFPGGLWHPEAALAASEAGFRYTTEAAIAWAGQPFISVERPYHLPLLQIPCSPVYPAFHELKRGGEEMFLRYFEIMAQQCMREKEMLSWMGHPFDLEPASDELWHTVEQIRANGGFKPVTMSEVDLMVRKRWQVKPRFTLNCGQWWVSANVEWDLLCQGIVIRIPAGGKKVIVTGKKISDI